LKNKLLLGVITFFISLIISIVFFNLVNSKSLKVHTFDRIFSNLQVLSFEKLYNKMGTAGNIMHVSSRINIAEVNTIRNIDSSSVLSRFYFSDYYFKKLTTVDAFLPKDFIVLMADPDNLIYTNGLKLYNYKPSLNSSDEIKIKNFVTIQLFSKKHSY
jgi:hypothetical protein